MKMEQTTAVERWGIFELKLTGPEEGNPFLEVDFSAEFRYRNRVIVADGFYDGNGIYKVRCMPDTEGKWTYHTKSNCRELDGVSGEFECTAAAPSNHGPVRVGNTYHFTYEDGTYYIPVGTTCYAWNHQGEHLEMQTLETLRTAPFNKMRMCVFPKSYQYNENEPEYHVFAGSPDTGFDYTRFNPQYFQHLETRVADLRNLGIECDLILFHPYDRWGYATMDAVTDDRYLKYVVARLAAYHNIWWSMANEFDFMEKKALNDWDRFFRIVQQSDPYQHLRSIHNGKVFYDYGKPWVTHCSIQHNDLMQVSKWRDLYRKPVVVDECRYEGNINKGWGNITAQELVCCFWIGLVNGGYVGHGETYLDPKDILWWSKGGRLHGQSPARIAFMRRILEEGPAEGLTPVQMVQDGEVAGVRDEYFLWYSGIGQPAYVLVQLPEGYGYQVEIIDTWEMTITKAEGIYKGNCRIDLPGKQYIGLRITKI